MSRIEEVKRQAVHLMAEKGFEAMSLRQLAAALGMHSGSVYTHYQSKAQLLLDLYCDYLEDLLSLWLEQRHQLVDGDYLLQRFISTYVSFHYARPAESRIVQLDFRSLGQAGRVQVDELKAQYAAELTKILELGERQGVFRFADLHDACLAILCVLQGVSASQTLSEARALEVCLESVARLAGIARSINGHLYLAS